MGNPISFLEILEKMLSFHFDPPFVRAAAAVVIAVIAILKFVLPRSKSKRERGQTIIDYKRT